MKDLVKDLVTVSYPCPKCGKYHTFTCPKKDVDYPDFCKSVAYDMCHGQQPTQLDNWLPF